MILSSFLQAATEEGFIAAGAVDIALAQDELTKHVARYDSWLQSGHQGEMAYLERGRDRRADPTLVFPEARSVLTVAWPYPANAPDTGPRFARYINGRDYHKVLVERLEAALIKVRERTANADLRWKICVDTSAVLERTWAALAGIGWIGKNTMLIHPRHGSYFFIGTVLINQETGAAPAPLPDYCGHCTRCLDACPTGAFTQAHELDARRCVSYLTLEHRAEITTDPVIRKGIGTWVAGCDICQEVCPFNLKAARSANTITSPEKSWDELTQMSDDDYVTWVKDSALKRVKPAQFKRNLEIALNNSRS